MAFRVTLWAVVFASATYPTLLHANDGAKPRIEVISAEVDSLGVYSPTHSVAWIVHVTGNSAGMHLAFSIEDWQGKIKQEARNLPAADASLRIVSTVHELGWFELHVALTDAQDRVVDGKSSAFSIEPEAHSSGRYFRYGICSHTAGRRSPNFENEILLLAKSGADMTRMDMSWNSIQPGPNVWNFEAIDKVVQALASRRIEFEGILGYTAQWATTGDPSSKDPDKWLTVAPNLTPYLNFVTTSVARYRGRVQYWEIWNEPDIGFWKSPTKKYVDAFDAASAAIKQVDPEAEVLNGGFAMVSLPPNPNFVRDFLKEANSAHWDIWAYHDYQTFPEMLARNSKHKQFYKSEGLSIPTWINEGGFHTLNPGGEAEQAVTLVKKYATAPALGVSAYFWYDLRDDGENPQDAESHFGLVRYNFTPKPAFAAFQVLVNQLAERRFFTQLTDVPAGVFGQLYRGTNAEAGNVLVIWREGQKGSTPVSLNLSPKTTAAYDTMGNPLPCAAIASGVQVDIGNVPIYLHFREPLLVPRVKPMLPILPAQ